MKKKLIIPVLFFVSVLVISIILMLIFSRNQENVKLGTWSENSFYNEWSNIKINIPDDYKQVDGFTFKSTVEMFDEIIGRKIEDSFKLRYKA